MADHSPPSDIEVDQPRPGFWYGYGGVGCLHTPGKTRSWCSSCTEWCSETAPCLRCEQPFEEWLHVEHNTIAAWLLAEADRRANILGWFNELLIVRTAERLWLLEEARWWAEAWCYAAILENHDWWPTNGMQLPWKNLEAMSSPRI